MKPLSLHRSKHLFSDPKKQLEFLSKGAFETGVLPPFEKMLDRHKYQLRTSELEILQVNLGYMCNQTCAHCHVDAGPDRKEIMQSETIDKSLLH